MFDRICFFGRLQTVHAACMFCKIKTFIDNRKKKLKKVGKAINARAEERADINIFNFSALFRRAYMPCRKRYMQGRTELQAM